MLFVSVPLLSAVPSYSGLEDGETKLSGCRVPVEGGGVAGERAQQHPPSLDPQRLQPGACACVVVSTRLTIFIVNVPCRAVVFLSKLASSNVLAAKRHMCFLGVFGVDRQA